MLINAHFQIAMLESFKNYVTQNVWTLKNCNILMFKNLQYVIFNWSLYCNASILSEYDFFNWYPEHSLEKVKSDIIDVCLFQRWLITE